MEIINEVTAIPLGFLTGIVISIFIGIPLLNRYLDSDKCKYCNSDKIETFAGIGACGKKVYGV